MSTVVLHKGHVVRRLSGVRMRAGLRSVRWDGRTHAGVAARPGLYVVRVTLRDSSGHRRVLAARIRVAPAADLSGETPATTLQWPVTGVVSSPFGPRNGRMHHGIDIPAPAMTPIVAAAAGIVRQAGHIEGYGLTVTVNHPDGRATLYAHQAKLAVTTGSAVTAGQLIGYVGRTGSSTTDHLHFELHDASATAIDPLLHLPAR